MPTWTVPATVVRVIDGDTVELDLDLGWRVRMKASARLSGIDAPELNTAEGILSKAALAAMLPSGVEVTFTSVKLDKYGRPLGVVSLRGTDINQWLVEQGFATPLK